MKELTADQRRAVVDHLLVRVVQQPCKLHRGAILEVAHIFGRNPRTIGKIWQRANVSLGGDNLPNREMVCEHTASIKKGRVGRKQKYTNLPERILAVPASQRTTIAFDAHAIGMPPTQVDRCEQDCPRQMCPRIRATYAFHDMYDYVRVDEMWFHATRIRSQLYLLPGEEPPHRSTQSKRFITKVMFLSAVARSRWDNAKLECTFVEKPSGRHNRAAAVNVTRPVYKKMLIDNVIPAIKALWPPECSRTVFIQQDNERPHAPPSDADIVKACTSGGWVMKLKYQPSNSPDLNTHHSNTYEDIVSAMNNAWKDVDPWSLERNFLTLQSCLREVIGCAGENSYKIPHMKKAALKKRGRLPEYVSCGKEIYDDGCTMLGQHDLSSVMLELSLQTARDLEMSDIFTALETLDIDDQDE
ncbi:hypothetical protein H257_19255 [Aphanomyces astaci]|uniref:DUF7769 domain-containing protein n=1 Tax=Aphanomyces astaci TaxID=112090 RepID=W4F8N0_APHAT|nr:hypothetical protein H257_19255 [Aphanomyces astaci]ETV63812.1 hypothetical protein H257_19255 [Aphanomyces astaci]|eukprot:XP_009846704.1 hypothetical protein H257_19255 [Aphanomyces astaci]